MGKVLQEDSQILLSVLLNSCTPVLLKSHNVYRVFRQHLAKRPVLCLNTGRLTPQNSPYWFAKQAVSENGAGHAANRSPAHRSELRLAAACQPAAAATPKHGNCGTAARGGHCANACLSLTYRRGRSAATTAVARPTTLRKRPCRRLRSPARYRGCCIPQDSTWHSHPQETGG